MYQGIGKGLLSGLMVLVLWVANPVSPWLATPAHAVDMKLDDCKLAPPPGPDSPPPEPCHPTWPGTVEVIDTPLPTFMLRRRYAEMEAWLLRDQSLWQSYYVPPVLAAKQKVTSQLDPSCTSDTGSDRTDGTRPIVTARMSETLSLPLFQLPGEMGLAYTLNYASPWGWSSNLDYWLEPTCRAWTPGSGQGIQIDPPGSDPVPRTICDRMTFHRPDGSTLVFALNGKPLGGGTATLKMLGNSGGYVVTDIDGLSYRFDGSYQGAYTLAAITNRHGVGWTFHYSASTTTRVITVTHSSGATFQVHKQWTVANGVRSLRVLVTDPGGNPYRYASQRSVLVSWGHAGFRLRSLTLPGAPQTLISFAYANPASLTGPVLMTTMSYNGRPYFHASYDAHHRATGTWLDDGSERYAVAYAIHGDGSHMTAHVTNPLGHHIVKQFRWIAGQYKLVQVSADAVVTCPAAAHSYAWNTRGQMTRKVDNRGVVYTYQYSPEGHMVLETQAVGTAQEQRINYGWDSMGRLVSVEIPGWSLQTTRYNATTGRVLRLTRNSRVPGLSSVAQKTAFEYIYDGHGILRSSKAIDELSVLDYHGRPSSWTQSSFDARGNLTSHGDALGNVTTLSNYNGLGLPGRIVGSNGTRTDFSYDARGRITAKTIRADGQAATWRYAYDGFGALAKVVGPQGQTVRWTRDSLMRVRTITRSGQDGTRTETFTYTADGSVASHVVSHGSQVLNRTTYQYDALGRLWKVHGREGQSLTYVAYDGNGNLLSMSDALGRTTRFAYDALNRVQTTTRADGGTMAYTYGKGGLVASITDPRGLVTRYRHDGLGQLRQLDSPDTGRTTFQYGYRNHLQHVTRADGSVLSYAHDALGRVTRVTATPPGGSPGQTCGQGVAQGIAAIMLPPPDDSLPPMPGGGQGGGHGGGGSSGGGTTPPPTCSNPSSLQALVRTYTWDNCTHGHGRLCSVANPDSTVRYQYTPSGQVHLRTFTLANGASWRLQYDHDAQGRLTRVIWPDGNQALYDYAGGAISRVRVRINGHFQDAATAIAYRPGNAAMNGWTTGNGLPTALSWDASGRMAGIAVPGVQALSFSHDRANRITAIGHGYDSAMNQTLRYDAMDRLTQVSAPAHAASYRYDANGNRISQVLNGRSTHFSYAAHSNQ